MTAKTMFGTIVSLFHLLTPALAFEGRINAVLTRGGGTQTILYTVGTNQMRIERGETNWPYAKNFINLDDGAVTILFPHIRSCVRLKPDAEDRPAAQPGFPGMPDMALPF